MRGVQVVHVSQDGLLSYASERERARPALGSVPGGLEERPLLTLSHRVILDPQGPQAHRLRRRLASYCRSRGPGMQPPAPAARLGADLRLSRALPSVRVTEGRQRQRWEPDFCSASSSAELRLPRNSCVQVSSRQDLRA